MTSIFQMKEKRYWLVILLSLFLILTLPLAFQRPAGGRSGERQGQTAGIIRMYCEQPSHSIFKGPSIHYGNLPFNLEFTLFEWMQGKAARIIGGPECNAVEPVAKFFSIIISALGILAAALLSFELATLIFHTSSPWPALFTGLLIGSNELWMRYSTYTMVENRVITCGVLAIFFSLRRKYFFSFLLWALTFSQKPQVFAFLASFWATIELILLKQKQLQRKEIFYLLLSISASICVGLTYYKWSEHVNIKSDLPWVMWMGPRHRNWFFGNWTERFEWIFYKNIILDWIKKGYLLFAAFFLYKNLPTLKKIFLLSLPFLIARFAYTFVFYPVVKVHEYYALPVNMGAAITGGCILGCIYSKLSNTFLKLVLLIILFYPSATKEIPRYIHFARDINNSNSIDYLVDWDIQIFPKPHSLVVTAVDGSGRDLLPMYLTKQHGFVWCIQNPVYAPRAFWKQQGVEFIAWFLGKDPKTKRAQWKVHTIDEELSIARQNGWSSDVNDVWANKPMYSWAEIASREGKDPCTQQEDYDPRSWEK